MNEDHPSSSLTSLVPILVHRFLRSRLKYEEATGCREQTQSDDNMAHWGQVSWKFKHIYTSKWQASILPGIYAKICYVYVHAMFIKVFTKQPLAILVEISDQQ